MKAKPHYHFRLGRWWLTVGGRAFPRGPNHLTNCA
jgi:hypothetical protein